MPNSDIFEEYYMSQYYEQGDEYWNDVLAEELATPETLPAYVMARRLEQAITYALVELEDEFRQNEVPVELVRQAVHVYLDELVDIKQEITTWCDEAFPEPKKSESES